MRKDWVRRITVAIIILFWFGLGFFGLYHMIIRNQVDSNFVLTVVSFGSGVSITISEVRLNGAIKGLENKIDGLGFKIDGINQRISDHLNKHK